MALIAQYLFKDNAKDEIGNYSGNEFNLAYENIPNGYNIGGKLAIFNGNNSKIDLPNIASISGTNTRTIEYWVRYQDSYPTNWNTTFSQGATGVSTLLEIICQNNTFAVSSYGNRKFSSTFIPSRWNHVVVTCASNIDVINTNIYINGFLSNGAQVGSAIINTPNSNCGIGYRRSDGNLFFKGKLANFRIYNHALSAEEVAAHYQAEKFQQPLVQFRPEDTQKWRQRFGSSSENKIVDSNQVLENVCKALPSCQMNSKPNLTVADGLYVLHQTRGGESTPFEINWELNRVINGQWQNKLTRNYTTDNGLNKAQAIKAAVYRQLTIEENQTLSVAPWDGQTGGVGVIFVSETLTIKGNLSANGKGFAGGAGSGAYEGYFGESATAITMAADRYNPTQTKGAAGGGGMGNNHQDFAQAGGGGGGHASNGGAGGRSYNLVSQIWDGAAGMAGSSVGQADLLNFYLGAGGGGGAGYHQNPSWYAGGNGGQGGGALIIIAKKIVITGMMTANGNNGQTGVHARSGAGGGGAGGSIVLITQEAEIGNNKLQALGGLGASNGYTSGGNGSTGRMVILYGKSLEGQTNPAALTVQAKLYESVADGSILANRFLE